MDLHFCVGVKEVSQSDHPPLFAILLSLSPPPCSIDKTGEDPRSRIVPPLADGDWSW